MSPLEGARSSRTAVEKDNQRRGGSEIGGQAARRFRIARVTIGTVLPNGKCREIHTVIEMHEDDCSDDQDTASRRDRPQTARAVFFKTTPA